MLVFSARRSEHITPLLRDLHWLPVPQRIRFRLCFLTYRCLNGTTPSYLTDSICQVYLTVTPAADFDNSKLFRPFNDRPWTTEHSMFQAVPRPWNSLPSAVRVALYLFTFWQELKTFFHHSSFVDHWLSPSYHPSHATPRRLRHVFLQCLRGSVTVITTFLIIIGKEFWRKGASHVTRRAVTEDWMIPFAAYRYWRWNDPFCTPKTDTVIDFLMLCTQ